MENPFLASFMEEEVFCASNGRKVMKEGVFCGTFGRKVSGDSPGECLFDFTSTELLSESIPKYHRTTSVSSHDSLGLKTVECSERSWIAVKGKEYTCVVFRDTAAEVKSAKPNVYNIFHDPADPSKAIVSVILGTNEVRVGNGIADSFAECCEEMAIHYLCERLKGAPALTYGKTLQTAISAYRRLFPGNINANEIKIWVRRNKKSSIRKSKGLRWPNRRIGILPVSKVSALLKQEYDNSSETFKGKIFCPESWFMELIDFIRGEVCHDI